MLKAKAFHGANVFMSRKLVPPEIFDALRDALNNNGAQVFLCSDPSRSGPDDFHIISSPDHEKFEDLIAKGYNLLGPQCFHLSVSPLGKHTPLFLEREVYRSAEFFLIMMQVSCTLGAISSKGLPAGGTLVFPGFCSAGSSVYGFVGSTKPLQVCTTIVLVVRF
uniref:Uncharacterized protein n=1 Tax=Cannabis sativa TaxID=3483 RepID=A0A803P4Z2_CANSA